VSEGEVDPVFERLYGAEFGSIFRAVLLLCGDRLLAEDATQEAFARAFERWRRLRAHDWAPAWITTTALNVARRTLRRRPVVEPADPPEADTEELIDLREAIRALPPRQQEAVILHHLQDRPVAEVARAMGVSEGTVKTHLHRGRRALGERLGRRVG